MNTKTKYMIPAFAAVFALVFVFTPYVMAGAGIGQNKLKLAKSATSKKTNLIWNAGLGCQAKVHDQVSVDLGYRYVNFGKLGKKTVGTTAYKAKSLGSNEVVAALVYNF